MCVCVCVLIFICLDFLLSFDQSVSSPKNDSLSLKWILESKTALPYFIDYLTTINCDSFISFYINIDGKFFNFKNYDSSLNCKCQND